MYHTSLIVREYARLTTTPIASTLDLAQIAPSAFDWLCELNASFGKTGTKPFYIEDRNGLRLNNFVGVLETPCGTRLEILPKHVEAGDNLVESRRLLRRMVQSALELPNHNVGSANLELFDAPLNEWVMQGFLQSLDYLVKRGVRFDYHRVEEEQRFMRGQLDTMRQAQQRQGRAHMFHIRHDVFQPDGPENRLLKQALEHVCKATQEPGNWRIAHELRGLFADMRASNDVARDFRLWRNDRMLAHYRVVKPWCELILNGQIPLAVAGERPGISLLFPMEKLFERFVAAALSKVLPAGTQLIAQAASEFLCMHNDGKIFHLKPDLLIQSKQQRWVLDTKWKRLDGADRYNKYGLNQGDFYQLFAYGQKYLRGRGELVLIYPRRHMAFQEALKPFDFDSGLRLWVLPFDLQTECLLDVEKTTLPQFRVSGRELRGVRGHFPDRAYSN